MDKVRELIDWLLLVLPLSVSARIVYCLCILPTDADRSAELKRRIRNALIFLVLAETVTGLLKIVSDYYFR